MDTAVLILEAMVKILSSLLLFIYYCLESLALTFIPKRLRSKDVRGEIVLITGAGSGIGRQLALRFARLGSRIVLWDINERGAEETAQMIREEGGDAHSYQCDVSQREAVYAAAAKVKDEVGQVSILVNNAGIVTGKRFLECPDHMIEKTFQVNALAHFWTCKAFLPYMIEANYGHLVSIASMAGMTGVPRLTDYCASKHAAVGFEESLRMELQMEGHTGIKSTVVCPFHIDTGMFQGFKLKLLKTLTPEYVADQIVSAVLVEQTVLLLPPYLGGALVIKSFFPTAAIKVLTDLFGLNTSMDEFQSRNKSD